MAVRYIREAHVDRKHLLTSPASHLWLELGSSFLKKCYNFSGINGGYLSDWVVLFNSMASSKDDIRASAPSTNTDTHTNTCTQRFFFCAAQNGGAARGEIEDISRAEGSVGHKYLCSRARARVLPYRRQNGRENKCLIRGRGGGEWKGTHSAEVPATSMFLLPFL